MGAASQPLAVQDVDSALVKLGQLGRAQMLVLFCSSLCWPALAMTGAACDASHPRGWRHVCAWLGPICLPGQ